MNARAVTNFLHSAAAAILLCCLFASAEAQAPSTADWSRLAPIDVPGNVTKGLVQFPITPEVFDAAKPDLSDLRIFDSHGVETGYVFCTGTLPYLIQLTDVPVESSVLPDADKRTSAIILDLSFRNLPLVDLRLFFADENFSRRISVYGRDSETRIVSTPREDAAPAQRTSETPWELAANTEIHRYTTRDKVDESLIVQLAGARFRYLKIEIANADDPPLQFTNAVANRRQQFAAFQPKPGRTYSLYFGNPNARAPVYDIVKYADRLRAEGFANASLGASQSNPTKRLPKPVPWLERNRWVLWVVLAAGVIVLAAVVARQLKSAEKPPDSGSPQT